MCDLSTLEPGQDILILFADGQVEKTTVLVRMGGTVVTINNLIFDDCNKDGQAIRLTNEVPRAIYCDEVDPFAIQTALSLGCSEEEISRITINQ